jgi:hypothetical protein
MSLENVEGMMHDMLRWHLRRSYVKLSDRVFKPLRLTEIHRLAGRLHSRRRNPLGPIEPRLVSELQWQFGETITLNGQQKQ